MSSVTRRRDLYVSLKLIVCIALGIWLGAMAVFLTGLLYYKSLPPAQTQALEQAATQLSAPPAQKAGKVAEPETEMFRKYEQSLRESEARQARRNRLRSSNSAPSAARNATSGYSRTALRPAKRAVPASISSADNS